jgi:hypothetical protein
MFQVLDGLKDALSNALIDENWKLRVSRQTDMRARYNAPDLTVTQDSQWLTINAWGRDITLPKAATDEHIDYEIEKIRPIRGHETVPTIAEQLAVARAKLAEARQGASDAVADSADAARVVLAEIEKVQKETAELRAEVATLTNGAPE